MDYDAVAKNLRHFRLSRHLTADKINYSLFNALHIHLIEEGIVRVTERELSLIASGLNVPLWNIYQKVTGEDA